jgi:uncharacterized protein
MNTFELDLLNFHGGPVELDMVARAEDLDWLLEGAQGDFRIMAGEEFRARLKGSLIGSTVRLTGTIEGKFEFACGRCLEMRPIDLDADVEFVLMSRASWDDTYEKDEETELNAEDLDVSFYTGDLIDLRELIREAVLLELPTYPQCSEERRHECDAAYEANVGKESLEKNAENEIDLRWSALKNIKLGRNGNDNQN